MALATVIEAMDDDDGLVRYIKACVSNSSLDQNGIPERQASVYLNDPFKVFGLVEAK